MKSKKVKIGQQNRHQNQQEKKQQQQMVMVDPNGGVLTQTEIMTLARFPSRERFESRCHAWFE